MNWEVASLSLFLLLFPGYSMLTVMRQHHKIILSLRDPFVFAVIIVYSMLYLSAWNFLGAHQPVVGDSMQKLFDLTHGIPQGDVHTYNEVPVFLAIYIFFGFVIALLLGSILSRIERPIADSILGSRFRRITPLPRDDNGFDCLFQKHREEQYRLRWAEEEAIARTEGNSRWKRLKRKIRSYTKSRKVDAPIALVRSKGNLYRGELCWAPRARNPKIDRAVVLKNAALFESREGAARGEGGFAVGNVYLPVTDHFHLEVPPTTREAGDLLEAGAV